MKEFTYVRAADADEAMLLVAGHPGGAFLAGGTNLVDLMRLGVARPDLVVDISRLPLGDIEHREDGSVGIGALVRNAPLAGDPRIRSAFPLLSQAVVSGASGQVRSMATVGGNLLQRNRCTYFQDVTKPCNKRAPGSGCPAIRGAHRELAVLGTSDYCVASHPSDLAVALVALGALVRIRSRAGHTRTLPLESFYLSPGRSPERETILEHGELVIEVEVPAQPRNSVTRYRKVRDRRSFAFALASTAVSVRVSADGTLDHVAICLGGVASRPWRARTAEALLRGHRPTSDLLRAAAEAEFAQARPLPRNAFKISLAVDLISATIRDLTTGSAGETDER
jgi:xanthine dehydrogenase YagS FAD-binding subunit